MKLLSVPAAVFSAVQLLLASSNNVMSMATELRGTANKSRNLGPEEGDILLLSRVGGQEQASLNNESPNLGLNYIIALSGGYPQYQGGQQTSGPMVGEIKMFAGNFAPAGWAFCEGQQLSIGGNDVLFSILGTTYGGDGRNTFALPDLRGRAPVHSDNLHRLGQKGGLIHTTLSNEHLPASTAYTLESVGY